MPRRNDIKSILIIGAGPIIIGQACEFDYSGTQACRVLKADGYRIILINSNPASIMTDPALADATYIEPINWKTIEAIIAIEKPDAILPTVGGQTALNCIVDLYKNGVLEKYNVELIGATYEAIYKAENRESFKLAMNKIGLSTPKSIVAFNFKEASEALKSIGLPAIIRPSFTLGGFGGGIAYTLPEYESICQQALNHSLNSEIQIDESIIGWKEFELEIMRDQLDNCIIVCSIENLDPVGVHTGDSITVAPAQTLTDKEYQLMRNASIDIMREIGVNTGGANVQFAINPVNGNMVVIEMNPRVSRSSALASKVTGYPIAKLAAKLAVGYTLDELANDITGNQIPASFEPTIDYVVVKIPRFDLDKFPATSDQLGTQMKSVGEVMGIGTTFQAALQKALCSLEQDKTGLDAPSQPFDEMLLIKPHPERIFYIAEAFRQGSGLELIHNLTKIDPWFLEQIKELVTIENKLIRLKLTDLGEHQLRFLKRKGFSDARIANLLQINESVFRDYRIKAGCLISFNKIDSCAAEFAAVTDYIYSSYNPESEFKPAYPISKQRIVIIGSGPNRIGQGIEFDYCCVHAAEAVREAGYEAIMINCNPETVSTDYDVSDRLYFEPIIAEKIIDIIKQENPVGVLVQFGGQSPLKLVSQLHEQGIPILGSGHATIAITEDRDKFRKLLQLLELKQPANIAVQDIETAMKLANTLEYPMIIRPSYVLGGKGMKIVYNPIELCAHLQTSIEISAKNPLLLENLITTAIEVDVDAVCDGSEVIICGILEQIEHAGVHSGDSASCYPTVTLSDNIKSEIKSIVERICLEIGAIGLINFQFAIKDNDIYIIEVNPRAARTIPFISKATGIAWVNIAVKCMLGMPLKTMRLNIQNLPGFHCVKESVFPFIKLPGSLPLLGVEMKSTGEVMGIAMTVKEAFLKAQIAAGYTMPMAGDSILITDFHKDKSQKLDEIILQLTAFGFKIILAEHLKLHDGNNLFECYDKSTLLHLLRKKQITYIINVTGNSQNDWLDVLEYGLRLGIFYTTSLEATKMLLSSLNVRISYVSLQAYHERATVKEPG